MNVEITFTVMTTGIGRHIGLAIRVFTSQGTSTASMMTSGSPQVPSFARMSARSSGVQRANRLRLQIHHLKLAVPLKKARLSNIITHRNRGFVAPGLPISPEDTTTISTSSSANASYGPPPHKSVPQRIRYRRCYWMRTFTSSVAPETVQPEAHQP